MGFIDQIKVYIGVEWRPDRSPGRPDCPRQRLSIVARIEARRPGRRLVQKNRRLRASLLAEVDGRDVGGELLDEQQNSPVERLNHDPITEIFRLQNIENERD